MNLGISRLHTQDYKDIGLEDYGKPGNYIERQTSRWTKQYFDSETEVLKSMHNLIDWLPKYTPEQKYTSIETIVIFKVISINTSPHATS